MCLCRAFACVHSPLSVSVMCIRLCAFTSLSRSRVRLCLRSPLRLWRSVYSLHPCSLPPCRALWPLSGLFAFGPFRLGLFASGPVSGVLFCSPLALRLRSAALRSSPPSLLFTPCHRSSSPPLSPLPRYPTVSDVVLDLGIWELVFRTGFWTSFWDFFIFILCNITGFFGLVARRTSPHEEGGDVTAWVCLVVLGVVFSRR